MGLILKKIIFIASLSNFLAIISRHFFSFQYQLLWAWETSILGSSENFSHIDPICVSGLTLLSSSIFLICSCCIFLGPCSDISEPDKTHTVNINIKLNKVSIPNSDHTYFKKKLKKISLTASKLFIILCGCEGPQDLWTYG